MTIQMEMIKRLREESGAGVMDCRRAWEQANMEYAAALTLLHEKAAAEAAKRAGREASQGCIEVYTHAGGRIGVMVEINTETDFAARSQAFRSFAHEIALQIAAAAPLFVREEDIPAEVLAEEARQAAEKARSEGKPEAILPRIVSGLQNKKLDQEVLLRQAYIRDETLRVAQLLNQVSATVGEHIVIRRFVRWVLDENS
jgi:elongation factor Ts